MKYITTKIFSYWLTVLFFKPDGNLAVEINAYITRNFGGEGLNAISSTRSTHPKVVPITQCCKKGIFYRQNLDKCADDVEKITNDSNDSQQKDDTLFTLGRRKVLKYSDKTVVGDFYNFNISKVISNVTSNKSDEILLQVKSTGGLTNCPKGFISDTTDYFGVFDNGFLKTRERLLKSDEYCLNKVETNQLMFPTFYVARFCIPDPCINGTSCVHKCCSAGFALFSPFLSCKLHSAPFNVSLLRNQDGSLLDARSFNIRKKYVSCGNAGMEQLQVKSFFILPDGRINVDKPTKEYCVDNLIDENNENTLIGMTCKQGLGNSMLFSITSYLSVLFSLLVILTFIIYAVLPEMHNFHGVIVMCYLAATAAHCVTDSLTTILFKHFQSWVLCAVYAVLHGFAHLATFSWLNVIIFNIWRVFRHSKLTIMKRSHGNQLGLPFFYCSVYGWGIPIFIVVFQHLTNLSRYKGEQNLAKEVCLFSATPKNSLIFLHLPVTIMLLMNLFMFTWTAIVFCVTSRQTSQATGISRSKQRFRVIFHLFLLTGVSSVVETIGAFTKTTNTLDLISALMRIIIGSFIFAMFVCKPKVLNMLESNYPCLSCVISAWERIAPCRLFKKDENIQLTHLNASKNVTND